MRKRIAALALALALALSGCGGGRTAEMAEGGTRLWFVSNSAEELPALASVPSALAASGRDETVGALMEELLAGPDGDSGLSAVIPAGTALVSWALEGRVAEVELSEPYGALTGIDLTLADYSIALTLTQLNGVDGVRVTAAGPGADRARPVRYPGDVVYSGVEEEPVEVTARLYFRRGLTGALVAEDRVFRLTESEQPALAVLAELTRGPEVGGHTALLPEGTEVYSTKTDGGVCYADFSQALLDGMPEDARTQELIVTSIVDTVCSLETVDQVQLLVEGQTIHRYGQVELSDFLSPSDGG